MNVAPAASDLTQAQFSIAGKTGRETILRRAMRDAVLNVYGWQTVAMTGPRLSSASARNMKPRKKNSSEKNCAAYSSSHAQKSYQLREASR